MTKLKEKIMQKIMDFMTHEKACYFYPLAFCIIHIQWTAILFLDAQYLMALIVFISALVSYCYILTLLLSQNKDTIRITQMMVLNCDARQTIDELMAENLELHARASTLLINNTTLQKEKIRLYTENAKLKEGDNFDLLDAKFHQELEYLLRVYRERKNYETL